MGVSLVIRLVDKWSALLRIGGATALMVVAMARLSGAEPHIDRIEPFLTNQVTIHFETDANRTYQLQFLHSQTSAWSNLYVAPKLPFPNHYVVVDTRTNAARLYRL